MTPAGIHKHRPEDDDLRMAMKDPQVVARLGHIHHAMNEALRIAHPELAGNVEYGIEHVLAYADHPESVARVLAACRRRQLIPFLDALDERIAKPARILHRNGRSVEPFGHVMSVFLELVANIDFFEDNLDVAPYGHRCRYRHADGRTLCRPAYPLGRGIASRSRSDILRSFSPIIEKLTSTNSVVL